MHMEKSSVVEDDIARDKSITWAADVPPSNHLSISRYEVSNFVEYH